MLSHHREAQAAPAELPGLGSLPGKFNNILTLFCPEKLPSDSRKQPSSPIHSLISLEASRWSHSHSLGSRKKLGHQS